MISKIEHLSPFLSQKIWGGERLSQIKNITPSSGPIGETWEVSRHADGPSLLGEVPLSEVLTHEDLPYLIKLIDTKAPLSVQVHPGDDYALEFENSTGKTECWLILEAKEGAGIYLGLKEGVSKSVFTKAIEDKGPLNELLNFYPVKRGDFFYVPAGSIHAIGEGIFLTEVQQSSGITYRVWDWNRVDSEGRSRELHINKALDVINFEKENNEPSFFRFKSKMIGQGETYELIEHPEFHVNLHNSTNQRIETFKNKRIDSIFILEGELLVELEGEGLLLNQYNACLLPPNCKIELKSKDQNCTYLHVS